jgi:1,2-diacylglycerol 3-beta-galactosyltransferase
MRLSYRAQVEEMRKFFAKSHPDLVVSLIPHFNRAIGEALKAERPGVQLVTVLTDIADHPPHFWIDFDHPVICGSDRAVRQAREAGVSRANILRTSGMILNPAFYEPLLVDRIGERVRLGLRPEVPTALVLFGGEGSDEMVKIARVLNRRENNVQAILLCGRNEKLAARLRAIDKIIPMHVEGFTREVPYYMELSDFFIGKPGPGSISEALAKRLPVIVQRNAWTLAHERYNADWVLEQEAGLVVKDFTSELAGAVRTLLEAKNYARFRQRAASIRNRAVFEIPDLLEKMLGATTQLREADAAASDLSARYLQGSAHLV